MQPSAALLSRALRLTLFTRPNCGLCTDAKVVISKVRARRPFEYDEIDVMESKNRKWKEIYEFDTPVLHVDPTDQENDAQFRTTEQARKLMHRFTEQQIDSLMADLTSEKTT